MISFNIVSIIIIVINMYLFSNLIRNFINGKKDRKKIKELIIENRVYIIVLALELIGFTLARIKFYIDFGI